MKCGRPGRSRAVLRLPACLPRRCLANVRPGAELCVVAMCCAVLGCAVLCCPVLQLVTSTCAAWHEAGGLLRTERCSCSCRPPPAC